MNKLKQSKNVTFTVNYAEGGKEEVQEGLLFEFQGENITLHLGTNRIECLFAVVEAVLESVQAFGLEESFERYYSGLISKGEEDE